MATKSHEMGTMTRHYIYYYIMWVVSGKVSEKHLPGQCCTQYCIHDYYSVEAKIKTFILLLQDAYRDLLLRTCNGDLDCGLVVDNGKMIRPELELLQDVLCKIEEDYKLAAGVPLSHHVDPSRPANPVLGELQNSIQLLLTKLKTTDLVCLRPDYRLL